MKNWISIKDNLPPPIPGWNHSEQVLVFYKSNEYKTDQYGIAYYHNKPPFDTPKFIDFHTTDRQPDFWMPLPNSPGE